MHSAPQEIHSPAFGHSEEREEQAHTGSNPKLGRRIKAAAFSFATKLHIPGTGASHSPPGSGLPSVEHHRVTAHHVSPSEVGTQPPQWQSEEPQHLQQQQQQPQYPQHQEHYEMPPTPATPLRQEEDITHERHQEHRTFNREAQISPSAPGKDVSDVSSSRPEGVATEAETHPDSSPSSARVPPGTPHAGLEHGQVPSAADPHKGSGSPTMPTPFFGVESPQRTSSDSTDDMKIPYIKPTPSLDRSTESQEVYVEDLETLAGERKSRGRGEGVKNVAQKLKSGYAMPPAVLEEEGEGEEEEEEHTHAGPSPMYSSYKTAQGQESVPAAGGAAAAVKGSSSKAAAEDTAAAAAKKEEEEQENLEEEIYAVVEAEDQFEKEEQEEDQAIAAARRRVELGEAQLQGGQPKAMTHALESPSGKIVIPALEVPDTIAVPRRGDTGRAFLQAIQTWVFANPILLVLFLAGTASLARAIWVAFTSTSSTLKDFGPLLLVSGAVALIATALARYTTSGGTINPLPAGEMAELDVTDSSSTAGGVGGVAGGGQPLDNLPPKEHPGPSEPVSKDTIEDIVHHPETAADPHQKAATTAAGKKVKEEEGVLEKFEHAVGGATTAAKQGLIKTMDPGQEMVGEVTQETDTGEKVLLPDTESPLHRGEDAVAKAAAKMKDAIFGGVGEVEKKEAGVGKNNMEGYTSDSDVSGPVIEGVHPVKDQGHVV